MKRMVAILCASALAVACTSESKPKSEGTSAMSSAARLTLVVDLTYVIAMGYGHRWKGTVREVRGGTLADPTINLSLMGTDYGGVLPCCDAKSGLVLEVEPIAKAPAALEGFVAADGTVYQLVSLRAP
jgi:hypothetical protein